MRITFGTTAIIIALVIFYFWDPIKSFFDEHPPVNEAVTKTESGSNQPVQPKAPQQKGGEKVDPFKEFK
jgi:hypothetical protein